MKRIANIVPWAAIISLSLLGGACSRDKLLGQYAVEMDKSLTAISNVPEPLSNSTSLSAYREQIRNQYEGKTLKFTSDPPHSFLLPVPLEGTVDGLFYGGWMRDRKDKDVVLVYQWVSGSLYLLWGRATCSNQELRVVLGSEESRGPVLYLRKK